MQSFDQKSTDQGEAGIEKADSSTARALMAIGQCVRDLRKARGMTLQQLADATELSSSMLSLVERGIASPSIGSLVVICDALGTSISELLADSDLRSDNLVTRASEAKIVETAKHVVWRVLRDDRPRGASVAVNEYAPGTGSSERPLHHEGYEYGLVIQGQLTVEVDGVSNLLNEGDLICYSSRREHRIWNHGKATARAVWFNIAHD